MCSGPRKVLSYEQEKTHIKSTLCMFHRQKSHFQNNSKDVAWWRCEGERNHGSCYLHLLMEINPTGLSNHVSPWRMRQWNKSFITVTFDHLILVHFKELAALAVFGYFNAKIVQIVHLNPIESEVGFTNSGINSIWKYAVLKSEIRYCKNIL